MHQDSWAPGSPAVVEDLSALRARLGSYRSPLRAMLSMIDKSYICTVPLRGRRRLCLCTVPRASRTMRRGWRGWGGAYRTHPPGAPGAAVLNAEAPEVGWEMPLVRPRMRMV